MLALTRVDRPRNAGDTRRREKGAVGTAARAAAYLVEVRLQKPLILIDRTQAEPRGERFHSCWQGRVTHTARHYLSVCGRRAPSGRRRVNTTRARITIKHRQTTRRARSVVVGHGTVPLSLSLSRARALVRDRSLTGECSPARTNVGEPNLHRALAKRARRRPRRIEE